MAWFPCKSSQYHYVPPHLFHHPVAFYQPGHTEKLNISELIRPCYAEVEPRASSSEQRSISWNSEINGVETVDRVSPASPLNRMWVCSCVQSPFKGLKLAGHRVTSLASSLSHPKIVTGDEQEDLGSMSSMKLFSLSQSSKNGALPARLPVLHPRVLLSSLLYGILVYVSSMSTLKKSHPYHHQTNKQLLKTKKKEEKPNPGKLTQSGKCSLEKWFCSLVPVYKSRHGVACYGKESTGEEWTEGDP